MTVSEYILGVIVGIVLIVLFILTLYSAGWWYTLGKLNAINSFFKSKSTNENYIFTAEYISQLSRTRAYDDYYNYKTKNEKENE